MSSSLMGMFDGSATIMHVLGRIGKDVESRYLPSGTRVTNFSVASNFRWVGKDGEAHKEVTWSRCSIFGDKVADLLVKHFHPGTLVYVIGRVSQNKSEDGRLWTTLHLAGFTKVSDPKGTANTNEDVANMAMEDDFVTVEGGVEGDFSSPTPAPSVAEDNIPF